MDDDHSVIFNREMHAYMFATLDEMNFEDKDEIRIENSIQTSEKQFWFPSDYNFNALDIKVGSTCYFLDQ